MYVEGPYFDHAYVIPVVKEFNAIEFILKIRLPNITVSILLRVQL
jgi:hypothetical protein